MCIDFSRGDIDFDKMHFSRSREAVVVVKILRQSQGDS